MDYDGQTTVLTYDTNGFLASVIMPYGRTATFHYANCLTNAELLSVTDAQGMTSPFSYEASDGFMNSLTTPYGTTTFNHFDAVPGSAAKYNDGVTRSLQIINPDGTAEMYAFFNRATNAAPFSYTNNLPNGGAGLDNGYSDPTDTNYANTAMYLRDSFYWGRQQCPLLSAPNLNLLTPADFLWRA